MNVSVPQNAFQRAHACRSRLNWFQCHEASVRGRGQQRQAVVKIQKWPTVAFVSAMNSGGASEEWALLYVNGED